MNCGTSSFLPDATAVTWHPNAFAMLRAWWNQKPKPQKKSTHPTASDPQPPDAPVINTFWPAFTFPWSRKPGKIFFFRKKKSQKQCKKVAEKSINKAINRSAPCKTVVPASGSAAASSNDKQSGLGTKFFVGTTAYSANAPPLDSI